MENESYLKPEGKMVEESESYLEKQWEIEKKRALTMLILMSVASLGLFFPFGYFAFYSPTKKAYLKTKALLEAENAEQLIRNLTYVSEVHLGLFTSFAIRDLKTLESGKVIFEHLKRVSPSPYLGMVNLHQIYTDALSIIASRHGYSYDELIEKFTKQEDGKFETFDPIPITKVYFIDEPSLKAKCMISGLLLDFDIWSIVACPLCGNMAKKDLLTKWLAENDNCPICLEKITIDDCPLVKIK